MSTAEYRREYMRHYVRKPLEYDECECGATKMRKSKCCRGCGGFEGDLKLTPDACRDCGIRPAPEFDGPDMYIPVIEAGYCDDCRLRRRRRAQYEQGVPSRLRSHTPMGPVFRKVRPLLEPMRKATELTIYGSSGRDAY